MSKSCFLDLSYSNYISMIQINNKTKFMQLPNIPNFFILSKFFYVNNKSTKINKYSSSHALT